MATINEVARKRVQKNTIEELIENGDIDSLKLYREGAMGVSTIEKMPDKILDKIREKPEMLETVVGIVRADLNAYTFFKEKFGMSQFEYVKALYNYKRIWNY